VPFGQGGVTGTVTAFRRELRGSGSFMDTDPAKIRGALIALPAELWGRSLTGGSRKNGTGVCPRVNPLHHPHASFS
jgi:hypothetical protein